MHGGRPMYFVTGRLKEIIIRGGEKLSPLAVERRLFTALPDLEGHLIALGFPHRAHGEEVGAYLETAALDEAAHARLTAALQTLPPEMRPKVVLWGTHPIPRTHTGKVQRRKLQPLFAAYAEARGAVQITPLPA